MEIWDCEWNKIKKSPVLLQLYIEKFTKDLVRDKNFITQKYNESILKNIFVKAKTENITNEYQAIIKKYNEDILKRG